MEVIKLIQQLIPLLDEQKDYLLILLLEVTVRNEADNKLDEFSVSPKEIRKMRGRLKMMVGDEIKKQNPKYQKLVRLLDDMECTNCKYNKNGDCGEIRIKACSYRWGQVYEWHNNLKLDIEKYAFDFLNNKDNSFIQNMIKSKIILNKLKQKLSNYDASKHKVDVLSSL